MTKKASKTRFNGNTAKLADMQEEFAKITGSKTKRKRPVDLLTLLIPADQVKVKYGTDGKPVVILVRDWIGKGKAGKFGKFRPFHRVNLTIDWCRLDGNSNITHYMLTAPVHAWIGINLACVNRNVLSTLGEKRIEKAKKESKQDPTTAAFVAGRRKEAA